MLSSKLIIVAVLLLILLGPIEAKGQGREIRVVDDKGIGVESHIYKVERNNSVLRLGVTNRDGRFSFTEECKSGEKIRAKPNSDYYAGSGHCPAVTTIQVTRRDYAVNLKANAERAEKENEFAIASLLYTELSARVAEEDEKFAATARAKSYETFARYLRVTVPQSSDPVVLNIALKDAIGDWQRRNGLAATGNLSYETLMKAYRRSEMVEPNIHQYLFEKPEERIRFDANKDRRKELMLEKKASTNKPPR